MKQIFFLLAFFVCNISFAQNWELGVKAGFNLASASIDPSTINSENVIGFHLGGYANTSIAENVFIQPEAVFSLQGYKISESRTISYLSVPVLVKYSLVEQFNVHAGPQVSFMVSAEDDIQDFVKSTDFSLAFGAEYQITELFGAGVRYSHGLTNILDNPEFGAKIRSRLLQLSCFYKLTK